MTLVVHGVSASYGSTLVLESVALSCERGQILGIVGPNGAGKSTLLKVIAGLLQPDGGRVTFDGAALVPGAVGYLPQRNEIDWDYPAVVHEIVAMGRYPHLGRARRLRAADRVLVADALVRLGLEDLADRPINALSGGQQQRAFLARALVQQPPVLLLDEPFAGIDALSQDLVWSQLRLLRDGGTIVVVVNHDLTQVEGSYDRMLLLSRRVVAAGEPAQVLTRPALQEAYGGLPAFLLHLPEAD